MPYSRLLVERAATEALVRHADAISAGRRLRYLRTAAGITQAELAAFVGCSQPTISRMESGARVMTSEERVAIARALGCSLAVLTPSTRRVVAW